VRQPGLSGFVDVSPGIRLNYFADLNGGSLFCFDHSMRRSVDIFERKIFEAPASALGRRAIRVLARSLEFRRRRPADMQSGGQERAQKA